MARKLEVEIIGDASSLNRALGQAGHSSSKLGGVLGKGLKIAALGAGAAFAGLAVAAKLGFDEFSEASKVAAQTKAVLKSTGGAANVTARQVDKLATSLMELSGVDDETIASGENMLLTFTAIHNQAGKNNDIFNQATKATLDLSVAMGKDMQSSAILVGKALNDPIKGLTSLTRVGVRFTDGQKDQIKAMVEAGDTMGAQKIILAELNKEFGGSAKAVGETLPGQLNILKETFMNALGTMGEALAPFISQLVGWATQHMPQIQATMNTAMTGIAKTIQFVAEQVNKHWGSVMMVFNAVKSAAQQAVAWFQTNWPQIQAVVARVAAYIKGTVMPPLRSAFQSIKTISKAVFDAVKAHWPQIQSTVAAVGAVLGPILKLIAINLQLIATWVRIAAPILSKVLGAALKIVEGLANAAAGAINGIVSAIKTVIGWIQTLIGWIQKIPSIPFHGGQGGAPQGGGRGDQAPGSKRAVLSATGGGSSVSVNFNGPVYGDPKSIAKAVREEFIRMQRGGTKLGFT